MLSTITHPTFAVAAVAELGRQRKLVGVPEDSKVRAAHAVFQEMHNWHARNLPMGAGAEISERMVQKGLRAVSQKFRNNPDHAEAYGIDPVTILTVISALFSIVRFILEWWNGSLG